jgi:hypothetical protein
MAVICLASGLKQKKVAWTSQATQSNNNTIQIRS